ncbi:MAG TPA: AI-2E family transporter [Gemmatimonadales bacterium]
MSEPGGRRLAATFVVLFAVGLLLVFLGKVAEVLFLVFISALLATYFSAVTGRIVRLSRLSRGPALAGTVLFTVVASVGIGALVVPPVVRQTQELIASLPALAARLETLLLQLARQYPLLERTALGPEGGGLLEGLVDDLTQFLRASFVPYLTAGGALVVELVSVLAMALYLARDPELYRAGLVSLVPPPVRHIARTVLADLADTMRAWIWAQLLAMAVLAVLTAVGLSLLRVPYALAFGVFTGLVAIVPFFGTIVSSVLPAIFVLGSGGWIHALAVAFLGVAIHLVEANIVAPLIFQERIRLPPVLTIMSVLIMATLIGVLGLIIAVPLLAATIVVVRHVLVEQVYGDAPRDAVPSAVLVSTSGELRTVRLPD